MAYNISSWKYPPTMASALAELQMATRANKSEGSSFGMREQHAVYNLVAQRTSVKTICEIGFNSGVSALIWLLANPNARVVMFDLWVHAAAPQAERFLRQSVLGESNAYRLVIYKGRSEQTVHEAARAGERCDVLSIDGGHSYKNALADLVGMHSLASDDNVALIDDTNCQAKWCLDVERAFARFNSTHGPLEVVSRHAWHLHTRGYAKGLTVFRYPPLVGRSAINTHDPTRTTRVQRPAFSTAPS